MWDLFLACISGLLAASSAAWGKVDLNTFAELKYIFPSSAFGVIHYGVFILINVFMWLAFVTAMKKSSNVISVIVINSNVNLITTVCHSFGITLLGNVWPPRV